MGAHGQTTWSGRQRPNSRPHEAVHAAPKDVEKQPATTFRVYQDNAQKFKDNDALTRSRQQRLQEAGAFRAPTNAARSLQPQYGVPMAARLC